MANLLQSRIKYKGVKKDLMHDCKNVYGDKVVYAECNRRNRLSEFQQYCLSSYTELFGWYISA